VLIVDAPVKDQAAAEIASQILASHARTAPLERVQDIDTDLDQFRYERPDGPVVMVKDISAVPVSEVHHPRQPGFEEPSKGCRAHEQ